MTFPTTSVLDNFNRANEGPPPSASWTTLAGGSGGHKVSTNQIIGESVLDSNASQWNAATFGPDCEGYFTLSVLPNDLAQAAIIIRYEAGVSDGYQVRVVRDDTSGDFVFLDSGGVLGSWEITLQAGDSFGVRAIGNLIEAYYKATGGVWVQLGSATDTNWPDPGYIAIFTSGDLSGAPAIDDFGGGDFVPIVSTIVIRDRLTFSDRETYPMFPVADTLTFTDRVVSVIRDGLTFTEAITVTMPDPVVITDTLRFYENLNISGPAIPDPDDPATGGLDSNHVLRLIYGNDKRNPLRVLDLAESAGGHIFLQETGFAPGSGETTELWTDASIRMEGQQLLATSRGNSKLGITYDLASGSMAGLFNLQNQVNLFFDDAKNHQIHNRNHAAWLEYRWSDGLNGLPTPTFGQLSHYYEIYSAKAPKWPQGLHKGELVSGNILGVTAELTASPAPKGLKQRAAIAAGAVSLHDKGVLVASGSSSKLHWPAYSASGLTGQFAVTGWFTPSAAWTTGVRIIFDYYYNASNRIKIEYDADNTRFVITKIVSGTTYTANSSAFTVTSGTDVHLVLVQDATTLHLYANGSQVASVAATATMTDAGMLALGCPATGTIDGIDAVLDGWRVLPDDITSTQAARIYTSELPIKQAGGKVGPPPYWWTKDGDGAIDNYDDSTHDNWGVLGGVGGDIEAEVSVNFVSSAVINGRTLWLGIKALDESFTPASYLWYTTFFKTNLDRTKLYGRYRRLSRLYVSAATTITHGWSNYNTTNYLQKRSLAVVNTSYKLLDFGDYFIYRDDTLADTLAGIFVYTDLAAGSLTLDFHLLLPWPYVKLLPKTSVNSSYGLIIENGSAFITDSPATGVRGDPVEYDGDPLTARPGKYNYLFALQRHSTGDIVTTDTATLTIYVTPRFLLPGGMVA